MYPDENLLPPAVSQPESPEEEGSRRADGYMSLAGNVSSLSIINQGFIPALHFTYVWPPQVFHTGDIRKMSF